MLGLKVIIFLISLIGCINLAKCAVAESLPKIHKDHPNQCWDDQTNTAHNPGTKFTPQNTCSEVRCNYDYSFSYESCGTSSIDDPSCKEVGYDLSQPYPDCCHTKYECTDAAGNKSRL